jgi:hypothetical protein
VSRAESLLGEISTQVLLDCVDSQNNVRLRHARRVFLSSPGGFTREKIPENAAVFELWSTTNEALILEGTNQLTGERCFVGVKAAKRGNDVCSKRQLKKLGFLKELRKDAHFFTLEDALAGKAKANVLWFTLTFNSGSCSLDQAWRNLSPEISRFLEGLKKQSGRIEHFLTPEVYPDPAGAAFGYPHVHMILLFRDSSFRVEPRWKPGEDGELLEYRVKEKFEIEEAGSWHSFIDVKALRNANGVASYCRKHMENTIQGGSAQAFLNNSITWLYRKKSYSMSREFRNCFIEFIRSMHVSGRLSQVDLFGNRVSEWSWECLGVGSMERLGMAPEVWSMSLDPGVVEAELRRKRGRLFGD